MTILDKNSGWHCVAVKMLHPQVPRNHQNSFHLAPHENVAWTCMDFFLTMETDGNRWKLPVAKGITTAHHSHMPQNGQWVLHLESNCFVAALCLRLQLLNSPGLNE